MATWEDFAPVLPQQRAAAPGATPAPQGATPKAWEDFRPVAELRNVPRGTRISGTTTIQDSPETAARIGSNVLAGMAPDEKGQIAILSRQMGIPETRFGVIDGNIVYQMDDGRIARAVPSVTGATGPIDAIRRGANWLASQFGPSLPGIAGGAAGIVTAPLGAGVPGAAGAAAVTDTARQAIGNHLAGRDVTEIDPWNVAGQAALAGAGQGVAAGINRLATRNPAQISAYDRRQAMDPRTLADAQARQAQAQGQGIPLTFGQSTGLRSGLAAERQLGRDPASMDAMQAFYETQRGGVRRAVDDFAGRVSPVATAEEGARMLREGAAGTIARFRQDRAAVARPFYDRAMQIDVGPAVLMAAQNDAPLVAPILKALRGDAKYADELGQLPDSSLRVLDLVKRRMDDLYEESSRAGRRNEARVIDGQRRKLLEQLDMATVDPQTGDSAYATARSAFAARSPEIDALTRGPAGRLAEREGAETARDLAPMFDFRQVGPQAVAQNRAAFEKAGQLDQWNAGLSTYIRDQMAAADGSPKKLLNRVWGNEANPREREVLKAAMTPVQWQGFRTLMQTLERVALTLPEGSPTATDMAGGQALRDQFGGAARAVGRMVSPQRALDIGGAVTDRIAVRLSDEGMAKLAQAVTDPNNLDALKRLRMMGPGSKAAMSVATQLMGGSLVGAFGGRTPEDFDPPSLGATTTSR